jgi:3-oxoacyl-[acyl-carrier protein] reductase
MSQDLIGRVALVTGAAQGIGQAIARELARRGAHVHLADRDEAGLADFVAQTGMPANVADLGNREVTRHLVENCRVSAGGLDILVHAAGGVCGQQGGPVEAVSEEGWRAIFSANVDSAMWLAQAATPALKASSAGRIIFIASGAGLRPSLTGIQAYTAAKHALVGLTKQLSQDLGPFGITTNAVAPGFVRSNPTTERQWQSYGPDGQKRLVESIHLRRLGTPEDIARAVGFFASDEAAWISGQILSVDGGRS